MKKSLVSVVVFACAASSMAAYADEPGKFSLGAGVFRTSGTYGGVQSTDIVYVPVTGKYQTGEWTYKLIVPYLKVTGPGNVLNGVGLVGTPSTARSSRSGLGDVIAEATRRVHNGGPSGFMVSLTGKVKFGTADPAMGLGTGKNDYAFQTNVAHLFGHLTAFGSVGYRIYGSPATYTLNNAFYGLFGGSYKFNPQTSGGLMVFMRQPVLVNGFPRREAMLFVNQKVDTRWKLQGYLIKGFANASPDFGAGASLMRAF
jgi:hypothetical protein